MPSKKRISKNPQTATWERVADKGEWHRPGQYQAVELDFGRPVIDVIPVMAHGAVAEVDYERAAEGVIRVVFANRARVRAWHIFVGPEGTSGQ